MLDLNIFFNQLAKHVGSCRSAPIVCGAKASFESWFRAEIIPVLWDLQIPADVIDTNYGYPDSRNKADLCARTKDGCIVFELKTFVIKQDSNKLKDYPNQIKRLETLVLRADVIQVVAFTTFLGYSEGQMVKHLTRFFESKTWNVVGPKQLLDPHPLFVVIADLTKQNLSQNQPMAIGSAPDSSSNKTPFKSAPQTAITLVSVLTKDDDSLADRIRAFVSREYIVPAREKKCSKVTIRAGDVHEAMGLSGRMPAVCSAIGSRKFQEMGRLKLVDREGPKEGSNVFFTFEILS
jgi:hypothetical protein